MNIKLYAFILAMTGVWGLFPPSSMVMKLILPLVNYLAIFYFIANYNKINSIFKKPLLCLLVCIVINIFGVWFLRGQSIISSMRGTDMLSIMSIFTIFLFHKFRLSEIEARKTLYYLMVTFIGCYILQWAIFPIKLFFAEGDGALESFESGGDVRFRMHAQGIAFLSLFYSLYRIIVDKKWDNYIMLALSFFVVVLFEFRSQLAILPVVVMLQLMYFYKFKRKKVFWTIFALMLGGAILLQTSAISEKLEAMITRNETQSFSNDDYIRFKTYEYYTEIVPENIYEKVFGTGLEGLDGRYQSLSLTAKHLGYIWADWGLIGLMWRFGIPGVLCLIWYGLKAYKESRKFPDLHYIGLWFLFLILVGTFNREFYRFGIFAIQAVALYIIDRRVTQYKQTSKCLAPK